MRHLVLLLALLLAPLAPAQELAELWSLPLGEGFSSVSTGGTRCYASYREPGSPLSRVVCAELETGAIGWRASFEDGAREGQEDYGGGRGPHATPLVHRGRVVVLGYGGRLVSLDAANGRSRWSVDLVEERGAVPVQFGFSASPVGHGDLVLVATGGAAGVTAFEFASGEVRWRSPARAASYVTPVFATLGGELQLVCVFRDATVGLDPATGHEHWEVPHVRPGLTNFAMLTSLEDGGLVVSGQGNVGSRCIDVERVDGAWVASVRWRARAAQFSHGRVVEVDGLVVGSNGSMLCGVRSSDGRVAFKLRGYGEACFVAAGAQALWLGEAGELSLVRMRAETIDVLTRQSALKGKAWAAPTVLGKRVLLRDAKRMVALELPDPKQRLAPLESRPTGYRGGAVEVDDDGLVVHQGGGTVRAVRR